MNVNKTPHSILANERYKATFIRGTCEASNIQKKSKAKVAARVLTSSEESKYFEITPFYTTLFDMPPPPLDSFAA